MIVDIAQGDHALVGAILPGQAVLQGNVGLKDVTTKAPRCGFYFVGFKGWMTRVVGQKFESFFCRIFDVRGQFAQS